MRQGPGADLAQRQHRVLGLVPVAVARHQAGRDRRARGWPWEWARPSPPAPAPGCRPRRSSPTRRGQAAQFEGPPLDRRADQPEGRQRALLSDTLQRGGSRAARGIRARRRAAPQHHDAALLRGAGSGSCSVLASRKVWRMRGPPGSGRSRTGWIAAPVRRGAQPGRPRGLQQADLGDPSRYRAARPAQDRRRRRRSRWDHAGLHQRGAAVIAGSKTLVSSGAAFVAMEIRARVLGHGGSQFTSAQAVPGPDSRRYAQLVVHARRRPVAVRRVGEGAPASQLSTMPKPRSRATGSSSRRDRRSTA